MCGIWDWQSTIVKDLNDSQDPKHTLFCREDAFVAIYALFYDNKCPLFTRLEGGVSQSGHFCFFYRFSCMMASLTWDVDAESSVRMLKKVLVAAAPCCKEESLKEGFALRQYCQNIFQRLGDELVSWLFT